MIGGDCGGDDDSAGAVDVGGIVSGEDLGAEGCHIGGAVWLRVAPADCDSPAAGHERESTHAGAANAHEMHRAGIGGVEQIHD
jgi:hypothetical protein